MILYITCLDLIHSWSDVYEKSEEKNRDKDKPIQLFLLFSIKITY